MEYCFHDWVDAPTCYLNIRDKLQKWEFRTVNHLLETLSHCLNIDTLSLFCRYCFGRCSFYLVELVSLPYSRERLTHCFKMLLKFSNHHSQTSQECLCIQFLSSTARFWNYLHPENFLPTYDLNGLKSRINRTIPSLAFF